MRGGSSIVSMNRMNVDVMMMSEGFKFGLGFKKFGCVLSFMHGYIEKAGVVNNLDRSCKKGIICWQVSFVGW